MIVFIKEILNLLSIPYVFFIQVLYLFQGLNHFISLHIHNSAEDFRFSLVILRRHLADFWRLIQQGSIIIIEGLAYLPYFLKKEQSILLLRGL